jgi:hypothetical protein
VEKATLMISRKSHKGGRKMSRVSVSKEYLDERFTNLERRLDEHAADLKEHLGQDRTDFDKITGLMQGPEGFITRLDRLEQIEARRIWHLRAIWVAVLTIVAAWFKT